MQDLPPQAKRLAPAMGASLAAHAGVLLFVLLLLGTQAAPVVAPAPPVPTRLVFMQQTGSLGGGGGSPRPAPPRPMEIPTHRQAVIIPVNVPNLQPDPPPVPVLDAPVTTNAAAVLQATGTTIIGLPGPGGGGVGSGLGRGRGPGVGRGTDGGIGGGPRRLGDPGISPPVPIEKPRPRYTAGAMQAKLTGEVWLEVVVLADGTVGSARIVQSLDRRYGLDQEALRTAKLWRFSPATLDGKPIDVVVTLVLEFRIY
jgi:protein TonB